MTKQLLMSAAFGLMIAACGQEGASPDMREADGEVNPAGTEMPEEASGDTVNQDSDIEPRSETVGASSYRASLEAIVGSGVRDVTAKRRDQYRNPVETILFFGIEPDDTVVEIWPGSGWYTEILSRYLATGDGKLYAAGFDPDSENDRVRRRAEAFAEKFVNSPGTYGEVEMTMLSADEQAIAPSGSADVVVTFRNVHNFEMGGWSDEAFAAFYDALKPGGVLGVVDHRLPEDRDDAMEKSSGYIKVSTVRELAEEAGFVLDEASEINANPNDTADHPFGVWTLPPTLRDTDRNGETPEGFDQTKYQSIGESDRMTLRFVKPEEPDEALLE